MTAVALPPVWVRVAFAAGALAGATGAALVTRSRLTRRLHTDALTGVANRAGLLAAWPRFTGASPVVAVVDLDGFKPVNDTYGHAAGDTVLTVVAARLRVAVGAGLAARLGGDEFALILPGPLTRATGAATRAAAAIARPVSLPDGTPVTVTASIGLAPATGDLGDALAAADAAMYRAKATRTGIAVHDPVADDRTTPIADPRPGVRVRDLPTLPTLPAVPAVSPVLMKVVR